MRSLTRSPALATAASLTALSMLAILLLGERKEGAQGKVERQIVYVRSQEPGVTNKTTLTQRAQGPQLQPHLLPNLLPLLLPPLLSVMLPLEGFASHPPAYNIALHLLPAAPAKAPCAHLHQERGQKEQKPRCRHPDVPLPLWLEAACLTHHLCRASPNVTHPNVTYRIKQS